VSAGPQPEATLPSPPPPPHTHPPTTVRARAQVRSLPEARSEHAELSRAALVELTQRVLTRRK
jgi:hypothetical protein